MKTLNYIEISKNEALKHIKDVLIAKGEPDYCVKELNGQTIHAYTGADLETAKFYLIVGSFTYKQLENAGINCAVLLNYEPAPYRWYDGGLRAWAYDRGSVELFPCQFPCNLYTKYDTESRRKNANGRTIVIACDSIKMRSYREIHAKKEDKTPSLYDRLQAFKRERRKNELAAYIEDGRRENDIENAGKLEKHLNKIVLVMLNNSGAVIEDLEKIENITTRYRWMKRDIERLSEAENMNAYNREIKELEYDYMKAVNIVIEAGGTL